MIGNLNFQRGRSLKDSEFKGLKIEGLEI